MADCLIVTYGVNLVGIAVLPVERTRGVSEYFRRKVALINLTS